MNTARQLTDLIKNKARNLGVDPQLLLKRYFMEQMLSRIAQSEYKENFILKGGLLISSLIGLSSRTTQDIDVSVVNKKLSIEEIKQVMINVCSIDLKDNIKYELADINEIREEFEYPGVRLSFKVYMDKIKDSFKIDITTGDTITPKETSYGYKLLLDDKEIDIYSYPIETIIAEKIESILSKSILGTRMRDYYDIYMLEKFFCDRINKENQKEALLNTCAKRNTENILNKPDEIIFNIENNLEQQNLWKNYASKNIYVGEVTFEDTIKSVRQVLKSISVL